MISENDLNSRCDGNQGALVRTIADDLDPISAIILPAARLGLW